MHAIQNKYTLTRINQPNHNNVDSFSRNQIILSEQSPKELLTSMDAPTFFHLMMELMYKNPPYPAIQSSEMTLKLRTLGLIPSDDFNFYKLHPLIQRALINAIRQGPNYIQTTGDQMLNKSQFNGWSMPLTTIGYYGTDYRQRAVIAMTLFGANIPQDTVYAYSFVDNTNVPLDGKYNYKIRFNSGQLPPAHAFWSVTLYNSDGFLVENQLHRYAISPHLDELNYNADGSLDLLIQHVSPGREKEANWLPAPLESFNLLLRMYWPQMSVLNGQWHPPMVTRVDPGVFG